MSSAWSMSRAIVVLVATMGSLACKPSSSCSDDVLRRTLEQLQQLDAALPLRTVTTGSARDEHLGAQVAALGLLDACSGLPPSVRADLAWRAGERSKRPSGSDRWALEREICPGYDAVGEGLRANAQRAQGDREPVDVMGLCKLDRFELVGRLRYTLSDDRLSNFVIYDQVVRRGGSPPIVRELVREFFVRTPFELDAELLAALPESPSAEHRVSGLGVRVSAQQVVAARWTIPDKHWRSRKSQRSEGRVQARAPSGWSRLTQEWPPKSSPSQGSSPSRTPLPQTSQVTGAGASQERSPWWQRTALISA